MLKIKVNDAKDFLVSVLNEKYVVNGEELGADVARISDTEYHVLHNSKSYRIKMVDSTDTKNPVIEVNGNRYRINLKDKFDVLLSDLGMNMGADNKAKEVKAPMPGLVVNVLAAEEEEVQKDAPLLILQAMKMENIIKAQGAGVVSKIHVKAGDTVEKNQLLISFS